MKTKPQAKSYVERTLEGLTARLEKGPPLSSVEVPLLLMLLNAQNSKGLVNYEEMFELMKIKITKVEAALMSRITKIEGALISQQAIKDAVGGSRRIPPQNVGPPNFSPFDNERTQ